MAIGRLSMKVGKAGKAAPHAAYIVREGQYASRLERGEKLEATEAGNMPAWAKAQPQQFWQAADAFERVNGTTYREMEIALPRELELEQRAELVRAFVRQEIGERHAYQWAIHSPSAADGGEQPHVHLMFSERQCDGIDRDPAQYFKRYNAKIPEKGGARKGYGPSAGKTLTAAERAAELKALRGRWEVLCNEHLAMAGHGQRIDMRSYAERGIKLAPERKQLPSEWRGQGKAKVIELRAARRDAFKAHRELANVVPNAQAEIINLEAERQKRATPVPASIRPPQPRIGPAEAERQRLARMRSTELNEEIRRRQLPSVESLVEQDRADQAKAWDAALHRTAAARQEKAHRVAVKAGERWNRRDQALQRLIAERPVEPEGMLAMFKRKAYQEAAQAWGQAQAKAQKLADQAQGLRRRAADAIDQAQGWAYARLKEAHPELHQRVQAHQEAERKQKIAQAMAQRQAKKQERGRGMQR